MIKKIMPLCLMIILLCGCNINVNLHDENKAAAEANEFLKILYFDKNYPSAFAKLSPKSSIRLERLRKVAEYINDKMGELKELQLYSYGPNPVPDAINIFYIGTHEKGASYHKIILQRNKQSYKVVEMAVANEPYPSNVMLGQFKSRTLIKK